MNLNNEKFCFGKTKYFKDFTSIVINQNVVGFQFHPEKSQKSGQKIIGHESASCKIYHERIAECL